MCSETIKFRQENRRRKRLREITTHIVLLLLVFMYSYIGAKLFQSIEEKYEQRAKGNLIQSKHHFLDQIQLGVGSRLVDQKNWTKMVDKLLKYYVEDLAEATSHGVDITDVTQHEYESASKWDFWGSLYYAGTVYTTIGYGNFAPVTPEGKVATIIYGMVGIPLCLILLADLGTLIAKLIKYTVKKIKKQWYAKSKTNLRELWPPQDEIDTMTGKSSFIVLCIVSLLYFGIGTVMYRTWEEDWSSLDAVYFIFVSTSTIGFGDVLPNHPKKFLFTSLYVFLGLSLLSSGFTILQDLLESRISEVKADLDAVMGIQKREHEVAYPRPGAAVSGPMKEGTTTEVDGAIPVKLENASKDETTPIARENHLSKERATPVSLGPTNEETIPGQGLSTEPIPNETVQEAISELIAVEESIVQQSVNNNTLSSAPSRFQAPKDVEKKAASMSQPSALSRLRNRKSPALSNLKHVETPATSKPEKTPATSKPEKTPATSKPEKTPTTSKPETTRVSETRLVSLDDGVLSVEATIILD